MVAVATPRCQIRNSLRQFCRINPTKLLSSACSLRKMDNAIVSFPGFDRFGLAVDRNRDRQLCRISIAELVSRGSVQRAFYPSSGEATVMMAGPGAVGCRILCSVLRVLIGETRPDRCQDPIDRTRGFDTPDRPAGRWPRDPGLVCSLWRSRNGRSLFAKRKNRLRKNMHRYVSRASKPKKANTADMATIITTALSQQASRADFSFSHSSSCRRRRTSPIGSSAFSIRKGALCWAVRPPASPWRAPCHAAR